MKIGAAFTKKLGPLPVWAWAAVVGGGGLAIRMLRGGVGNSSSKTPVQQIPVATTDLPDTTSSSFINDLSARLQKIQDQITTLASNAAAAIKPPGTGPGGIYGTPDEPPRPYPKPVPISAKPSSGWLASLAPANWPAYAKASLATAQAYAKNIIRNYSPGGAFYKPGTKIPKIPVTILPLAEQQALARQYHGTLA